MLIGTIGAGNIGTALAELALAAGHQVVLSNSRGPGSLDDLVGRLGAGASAATPAEVVARADVVVVTVPLHALEELPADVPAGTVVVDTCNYYPARDGRIAELDDGSTTSSELVARRFAGARVVKAFNSIWSEHLRTQGRPAGTTGRRALPIAGDDEQAKSVVADLTDAFGFDVVDAGPLAEGRRFEPGTAAYDTPLDVDALRRALAGDQSA